MEDSLYEIVRVRGLPALDSRGRPTVRAVVETRGGRGYALAPSGASTGEKEAVELRDGGRAWKGRGVGLALARLETVVAPALVGLDSRDQAGVDTTLAALDGTPNKSFLGGNTTTAVSMAVARAAASTSGLPLYRYLGGPAARLLPTPLLNVINGGAHAGNPLDLQEFMIIPVGASSILEALRMAVEVYEDLKSIIAERYGKQATAVGDEGGFAPPVSRAREALDLLAAAVERAGYTLGRDFLLGLDAAASQLYRGGKYVLEGEGLALDRDGLLEYYESLAAEYPIAYLEDPFDEDDWEGFREATKSLGGRMLIVGDDAYCTNPRILERALREGVSNAALLKVNQVGTLSEALEYARLALHSGLRVIVSHRSGDTEDPFIADLAVALQSGLIKTGAPARGERTAKYNRLIEIEAELGGAARYAGRAPFP
ncbi:MAG: phosphopyruvate hydratase [Desulfurococcales archaeon]|nr:phosphopyruvate hydratase [Desulfurococcales archaeon]